MQKWKIECISVNRNRNLTKFVLVNVFLESG